MRRIIRHAPNHESTAQNNGFQTKTLSNETNANLPYTYFYKEVFRHNI
jgi:hypothetical protein